MDSNARSAKEEVDALQMAFDCVPRHADIQVGTADGAAAAVEHTGMQQLALSRGSGRVKKRK